MKNPQKNTTGISTLIGDNSFTFFLCGVIAILLSWPYLSSFIKASLQSLVVYFFSILAVLFVLLVISVIIDKKQ